MKFRLHFLPFIYLLACTSELKLPVLDYVELEESILKVEVLASNLDVPWDLEYSKDGYLWFNEQAGRISRINLLTGEVKNLLTIEEVWKQRTTGLLGLAIHPDFQNSPYIVVNYTVKVDSLITNKLVRYFFENEKLTNPIVLLEIPGNTAHNGSRLKFTQDGKILWATGDAYGFENAQNAESLNGKVLRINIDGTIPSDNPDPQSFVWARGFRNIQGMTLDAKGVLYTSEHGDAIEDEINLIVPGGNFGWPFIEGMHDLESEVQFAKENNSIQPIYSWTPVVAPAGLDYYEGLTIKEWNRSLLLTTLKGQSLRVLKLSEDGHSITHETIFFENHYGRLRDVAVAASGEIYIATSNKDWNPQPGFPIHGDDKILKISISQTRPNKTLKGRAPQTVVQQNGKQLYSSYCSSCHKEDGKGVTEVFPSLVGNRLVMDNKDRLIELMLIGQENQTTGVMMPSFSFLDNQEIASILTYIRTAWGNNASAIDSISVKEKR